MHLNLGCTLGSMSARLISLMGSLRPFIGALILFPGLACVPVLRAQSAAPAPAQTPATLPADAQFDVAAIHPHIPEPHERSHIISDNGSFTTINVDLKSI